jgi:hypothetical protein
LLSSVQTLSTAEATFLAMPLFGRRNKSATALAAALVAASGGATPLNSFAGAIGAGARRESSIRSVTRSSEEKAPETSASASTAEGATPTPQSPLLKVLAELQALSALTDSSAVREQLEGILNRAELLVLKHAKEAGLSECPYDALTAQELAHLCNTYAAYAGLLSECEPIALRESAEHWRKACEISHHSSFPNVLARFQLVIPLGLTNLRIAMNSTAGDSSAGRQQLAYGASAFKGLATGIGQGGKLDDQYVRTIVAQLSRTAQSLLDLRENHSAWRIGVAGYRLAAAAWGPSDPETLNLLRALSYVARRLEHPRIALNFLNKVAEQPGFEKFERVERVKVMVGQAQCALEARLSEVAKGRIKDVLAECGVSITPDGCLGVEELDAEIAHPISVMFSSAAEAARAENDWAKAREYADASFAVVQRLSDPDAILVAGQRAYDMWGCFGRKVELTAADKERGYAEYQVTPDIDAALHRLEVTEDAISEFGLSGRPALIEAKRILFDTLANQGRLEEAERKAGEILALTGAEFGESSSELVAALSRRVRINVSLQRPAMVERYGLRAIEIAKTIDGIEPEVVLDLYNHLTLGAESTEAWGDAQTYIADAKEFANERCGNDSFEVLRAGVDEAELEFVRGINDRSPKILERAVGSATALRERLERIVNKQESSVSSSVRASRSPSGSIARCMKIVGDAAVFRADLARAEGADSATIAEAQLAFRSLVDARRMAKSAAMDDEPLYIEILVSQARALTIRAEGDEDQTEDDRKYAFRSLVFYQEAESLMVRWGLESYSLYRNVLEESLDVLEQLDLEDTEMAQSYRQKLERFHEQGDADEDESQGLDD